ncbi:MAG: hypothetical protein ACPW60_15560 [Methylohalobius sp. ZOD2]
MATPKSLVAQLHRHWEIIEDLARASRDMPAFEERQVLAVIAKHQPQAGPEDHAAALRSLCNADLLQLLSRTSHLQLNPLVLEFVRGLTREHELGLSSVLKARVEAIRQATEKLREGLHRNDSDLMRRGAGRLSELFRQIGQQLDQDRHAILELAENAKASDAAMPIDRRYQAVLEAYDQYVEPMNEMMDSGSGGTFYPYLVAAEQALDAATEVLSVRGALYTHRLQLRQVAYQAKELRRLGRVVAQQCADTLLPLREEARQHNQLSASISHLLGRVRKQGLARGLRRHGAQSKLPLWQRERRSRIHLGDEIRTLMAEARDYTPRPEAFPEELPADPADLSAWVDETELREALQAALPVHNLMTWLQQRYPNLPDAVVLRLYHDLAREPRWQAQLQPQTATTDLKALRVHYHPHQLQPLPEDAAS